jgi:hypothetical protein
MCDLLPVADLKEINPTLSDNNLRILSERLAAFDTITSPRVGDYIRLQDGDLRRFTHDWADGLQTTVQRGKDHYSASFYLSGNGYADFSGSLDPVINRDKIHGTSETEIGGFWFFSDDQVRAHNGVQVRIPCRVYEYRE